MGYISHSIKNLGNFSGRANRTEYWQFFFFGLVINAGVYLATAYLEYRGVPADLEDPEVLLVGAALGVLGIILFFANLALIWRRSHDVGMSGCLGVILIFLVIGVILLAFIPGNPGRNHFGEPFDPLSL
ncbi:MAG: DUF805 domain-containing protein [Deltaproteobacteria bacterium]|jgi:uncharacterized membrane protein YhaH (DUF805 family)|nr:DUF805 domain-containing protein [Deltaproteobacteria bacterium]